MKSILPAGLICMGMLFAPAAMAQVSTEKAPATDSEGVGSEQQAETEKSKSDAASGSTQTWGGGPKSGALHEDWMKWMMAIKDAPKGFIPVPPPSTKEPAPEDPAECGRVLAFYYENSDDLQEGSVLKAMEGHLAPCKPGS